MKSELGDMVIERDTCWDSGCTFPLPTIQVIKGLGVQLDSLSKELMIIEASGSELEIFRTARIFLQTDVLGCLVSLGLLNTWDLIHDSFPLESVTPYVMRMYQENKSNRNFLSK